MILKNAARRLDKIVIAKWLLFVLILLIQIGITISITYFIKIGDDSKIITVIQENNNRVLSYINSSIEESTVIIKRNAAFFRINGIYLSSKNYTDLLQNTLSPKDINIYYYVWISKISNNSLDSFQMFCNNQIIDNCSIRQVVINPNNRSDVRIQKATGSDYYYPITFVEPPLSARVQSILIGLDLNTINNPNNIIKIANSSQITVTTRIKLFARPNPYSYDFGLNFPSFISINNTDLDKILGYSSVFVNIGDMLDQAIKTLDLAIKREYVDFFLFDLTSDGYTNIQSNNLSLLYKENKSKYSNIWFSNDLVANNQSLFSYEYIIGARKWNIMLQYSDDYIKNSQTSLLIIIPCIILPVFLLLNLICVIFLKFIYSLKERAILEKNKNTASTQMLGYVNHEIRNPLNVIKGLVQFTLQKMIDFDHQTAEKINIDKDIYEAMVSDLSTVVGSCNMLEHIVTDILDIQKLDSGKLELNNQWIKIDCFVHDIYKTISQKIDEKQTIKFKTIYDPGLKLFFDEYRMKQILLNFLTNSIKYTMSGEIILKIEKTDVGFQFSITDTGRGIHDEAKSSIFQPFNQSNPEDASRYGGIGLGLYLCKMLTERMNGKIGFESTFGQGSTFWVEFPEKLINPTGTYLNDVIVDQNI